MTVSETKRDFVSNELFCLLKKIDKDIKNVEYVKRADFEEFVKITWDRGSHLIVCVTADSLWALTRDVLEEI